MGNKLRKRIQFKFWLDEIKPDEQWLITVCDWLMEQKQFVKSVRDGLRLIYDLRHQRSTASLEELFPDIRAMLNANNPQPVKPSGGGELQEIKNMLEIVVAQVKDDNRLIMNGTIPMGNTPTLGTGKAIKSPTLTMPTFDDEDTLPMISVAKNDDDTSANNNFMKSLTGLRH